MIGSAASYGVVLEEPLQITEIRTLRDQSSLGREKLALGLSLTGSMTIAGHSPLEIGVTLSR